MKYESGIIKLENYLQGQQGFSESDLVEALTQFLSITRQMRDLYDDFFADESGAYYSADKVRLNDNQMKQFLIRFACIHHEASGVADGASERLN